MCDVCFQSDEFYVCVYAAREGDYVLFHHEGGVEVGDVDAKAQRLLVAVGDKLSEEQVTEKLLVHVSDEKKGYTHVMSHLKCYCCIGLGLLLMLGYIEVRGGLGVKGCPAQGCPEGSLWTLGDRTQGLLAGEPNASPPHTTPHPYVLGLH